MPGSEGPQLEVSVHLLPETLLPCQDLPTGGVRTLTEAVTWTPVYTRNACWKFQVEDLSLLVIFQKRPGNPKANTTNYFQ